MCNQPVLLDMVGPFDDWNKYLKLNSSYLLKVKSTKSCVCRLNTFKLYLIGHIKNKGLICQLVFIISSIYKEHGFAFDFIGLKAHVKPSFVNPVI